MKKVTAKNQISSHRTSAPIGEQLSFAATEAYKLLRTNLQFSISGDRRCKIVGVVSAIRSEGKTTTSVNLAYALAETGQNVLLIDGDMRLPKIAGILKLNSTPGLSNVLAGLSEGKVPYQKSKLLASLYVLASGDIPPNPSELLGSKNMHLMLDGLTEYFDYIIIDLPPVNIVSDAIVLAPICDGMILVTRQDYTSRRELAAAVEQLEFCQAKILGFVLNDAILPEKTYKKRYYRKGYYGHSYRYGSGKYGHGNYGYDNYGYSYGYGYGYGKRKKTSAPAADNRSAAVKAETNAEAVLSASKEKK